MMSPLRLSFGILVFYLVAFAEINCQYKPGRGSKDKVFSFDDFLLKASKSVPRIGRRNFVPSTLEKDEDLNNPKYASKYPVWSELPDWFEYDPELFAYPNRLWELEQLVGDDPSVYDFDKVRLKRTNLPSNVGQNKEIVEYRSQADNYMM